MVTFTKSPESEKQESICTLSLFLTPNHVKSILSSFVFASLIAYISVLTLHHIFSDEFTCSSSVYRAPSIICDCYP